jgi:hypothetical protein
MTGKFTWFGGLANGQALRGPRRDDESEIAKEIVFIPKAHNTFILIDITTPTPPSKAGICKRLRLHVPRDV